MVNEWKVFGTFSWKIITVNINTCYVKYILKVEIIRIIIKMPFEEKIRTCLIFNNSTIHTFQLLHSLYLIWSWKELQHTNTGGFFYNGSSVQKYRSIFFLRIYQLSMLYVCTSKKLNRITGSDSKKMS